MPNFLIIIHNSNKTVLNWFEYFKSEDFSNPWWRFLFIIFTPMCLHYFLSDGDLYPTICISNCTSLSSNDRLLKSEMNNLCGLLDKFCNQVNKTCLLVLVIEHTSKLFFWFFIVYYGIKIDNSISDKIITTYFFSIH